MNAAADPRIRLVASPRTWIPDEALRQLYSTARLEGVELSVGFPNLQAGGGTPVGITLVSRGVLHPHLLGQDVGCGITLFGTDLLRSDARLEPWAAAPFDLEHAAGGASPGELEAHQLKPTAFDGNLGTLGTGSHFAELQSVADVFDPREFRKLGLGRQQLALLVHSGSGGLGEALLDSRLDYQFTTGVSPDSFLGQEFLRSQDQAVRWARLNREIVARRFAALLGAETTPLWEACHNSITSHDAKGTRLWIHRRGTLASNAGPVLLAGSRGSLTYVLKPLAGTRLHGNSLPHASGRKWARSEARLRMRQRFGVAELLETPLGSRVICGERDLLYEDAPSAYKEVGDVVEDLVDAGLVAAVATLRPLLTYKNRKLRR